MPPELSPLTVDCGEMCRPLRIFENGLGMTSTPTDDLKDNRTRSVSVIRVVVGASAADVFGGPLRRGAYVF